MDIRELEKNKYYYGKLLTVTDFEVEQQYYAKKAKLTNRIMYGVGVASGLQVTSLNDTQLAVESGVAIDYGGNMILVPIPLTITLSNLSGYLYDGPTKDTFYLCLRYKEKEKDMVKSTNSHVSSKFNDATYNRIVESYELYLQQGLSHDDFHPKPEKVSKKARVDKHFSKSLTEMVQHHGQNCLCLGKVTIERKKKSGLRSQEYVIQSIESVPFKQYVYNQDLLKHMVGQRETGTKVPAQEKFTVSSSVRDIEAFSEHEVCVTYDKYKKNFNFDFGIPKMKVKEAAVETGVLEITLKSHLFTESYVSEEISHGLGSGMVYMDTAIEKIDSWMTDDEAGACYYGDSEVFSKTEDELALKNYSIGCIVYPDKGTFKLGVKYHGAKKDDVLKIRWWAIKGKETL